MISAKNDAESEQQFPRAGARSSVLRTIVAAAIAVLLLAGCGGAPGSESGEPANSSSATAAGSESPAQTGPDAVPTAGSVDTPTVKPAVPSERSGNYTAELAITLVPRPGADPVHYVLACDGTEPSPDSNVPAPAAACELIDQSAEALFFTKRDPTLQCTQQFGGPQTATIKGTIDSRPIDGSYSLSDGCEIDRWRSLEPLLGPGGAM